MSGEAGLDDVVVLEKFQPDVTLIVIVDEYFQPCREPVHGGTVFLEEFLPYALPESRLEGPKQYRGIVAELLNT